MQVRVVTDNHVNGSAGLIENVEADFKDALRRFSNQITRIEVHLGDVNGPKKTGDDKHCLVEARLAGRPPVVVSHDAATVRQALDGAIGKLERSLEKQLDKLSERKGRVPQGGESSSPE